MIDIVAPASKSCAQRAVLCATLAPQRSVVRGVGRSDDLLAAVDACRALGAIIDVESDDLQIIGTDQLRSGVIEVGESGLLTRLVAPVATLADGRSEIRGRSTLCRRPMRSLIEALVEMGVTVNSTDGYLPISIERVNPHKSVIRIDGSDGSQVLSGLLIALPLVGHQTTVEVENLRSRPYIDLTISILSRFGIEIQNDQYRHFTIDGSQHYSAVDYRVEGDWSGASYFLVADAIAGGGRISVSGLDSSSTQADRAIVRAIDAAKGLRAFDFDATHCPDLFPSLVALASHCEGQSRIEGASRLRHKESARDLVLRDEWSKFGVEIKLDATDDTMIINGLGGRPIIQMAPIDPHGDHRIAMAAAIMGRGVRVDSREVVNKSFPEFWTHYQRIEHLLND